MTGLNVSRCPKCNHPLSFGSTPTVVPKEGDLVHVYYHVWCEGCGWTGTKLRKGSKRYTSPSLLMKYEQEEVKPEIPDPRARYMAKYFKCKKAENLSFDEVLRLMNKSEGEKITPIFTRVPWNYQLFVYMTHGKTVSASDWTGPKDCIDEDTQTVTIRPHIDRKTVRGDIIIGWKPSQEDMDANDWIQCKPVEEWIEELNEVRGNVRRQWYMDGIRMRDTGFNTRGKNVQSGTTESVSP